MPVELLVEGIMAKSGDVYSFGVMLFELYTGNRAWAGSSQAQVIFAITCRNEKLKLPENTPPRYAKLVEACMGDRNDRPTFEFIIKELEEMLQELPAEGEEGENSAPIVSALPVSEEALSPPLPLSAAESRIAESTTPAEGTAAKQPAESPTTAAEIEGNQPPAAEVARCTKEPLAPTDELIGN